MNRQVYECGCFRYELNPPERCPVHDTARLRLDPPPQYFPDTQDKVLRQAERLVGSVYRRPDGCRYLVVSIVNAEAWSIDPGTRNLKPKEQEIGVVCLAPRGNLERNDSREMAGWECEL